MQWRALPRAVSSLAPSLSFTILFSTLSLTLSWDRSEWLLPGSKGLFRTTREGGDAKRERESESTEFVGALASHPGVCKHESVVRLPLQSLPLLTLFFTTSQDFFPLRFLVDKE